MLRPSAQDSCSVLEGQVLEHVLRLDKIEVLSVRARYRAPNARALLIIAYKSYKHNENVLQIRAYYRNHVIIT
jgi:hypothetical protein